MMETVLSESVESVPSPPGRGLYSSTSHLNLSCFCH